MINWQAQVVAPCVSAFGQSATLVWGAQNITLNGVFDEAFAQTDVSDGMPVTTVQPCFGVNVADLNLGGQPISALQGARLTVLASAAGGAPAADTTYIVQEGRADGHGAARLILNLAPTEGDEPDGGGQDA